MSATIDLGVGTFEGAIEKRGILLVDWWAPWCGPCRAFGPIYEKVAARHRDVTFAKINTEEERALASAAGIRSVPTLMVIREGILLQSQAGALSESALEDVVRRARAIDMEAVRAEIARHDASAPDGDGGATGTGGTGG